ncbi:hypothetical protein UJ101_00538 [Flavobacteriaceae bacterium UJ101]|nr:hypothetical protein UJ101_00538 [Flavobacteriaceae bacterium UJ101]
MIILFGAIYTFQFFLLISFLFNSYKKSGFSFKLGICFSLLYFIFIPLFIYFFYGEVKISKIDFGNTSLETIYLENYNKANLYLSLFNFSILIYLYLPLKRLNKRVKYKKISLTKYGVMYFFSLFLILVGSGILKGGNWYQNRHDFFISAGGLAILITYCYNASKLLLIGSFFYLYENSKLNIFFFIFISVGFGIFDTIISGNRIYLFGLLIALAIYFISRLKLKQILILPLIIPVGVFLGYFASIFRHMRGPLFADGIPTYSKFIETYKSASLMEPFEIEPLLLGISESVNFNVLMQVFNDYNSFLYGKTYLKSVVFFIPRSLWESKPHSITVVAAQEYNAVSLVTTIIGEMYMNFALIGLMFLPFILIFLEKMMNLMMLNNIFNNVILFILGILFFRMPFSDELLVFIFLVLILKISNFKFVYGKK